MPELAKEPPKKSQYLYQGACVALAAVLGYYFVEAKTDDTLNKIQGLIILFLAIWPSVEWTKASGQKFPLVEVLMLATANSYGLPLLAGHERSVGYPGETVTSSAWVVIVFQAAVYFAYKLTKGQPKRSLFWTEELLTESSLRILNYGIVVNTVYMFLSDYTTVIPYEIDGVVRAACFGIGTICTFITAQFWGSGTLKSTEKGFFIVNIILQTLLQTVNLYLFTTISLFLLALIGYVTRSNRVPVVLTVCVLLFVAVLHNGESAMRAIYWHPDGNREIPALNTLPAFYEQWVTSGLAPSENPDEDGSLTGKLLQRTSLFQMVCLVVQASPDNLPFLAGETYAGIPAGFIPRFLWPDKPNGLSSTYRLGVYYNLQTVEDTASTTIAFGQISEAYANFGFFGVGMLGALTGLFYKKVQIWASDSPMISYPGVLLVILMAWSFQTEFTLATWIISFFQACVSVMGLMLGVRMVFK